MSAVVSRPPSEKCGRSLLLPVLLGALAGVVAVKAALLTGLTAGLEAEWGRAAVAWGGKLAGLAIGAGLGWLVGRRRRGPAADL
jgi:membrane associated rhomboid family serine protease